MNDRLDKIDTVFIDYVKNFNASMLKNKIN